MLPIGKLLLGLLGLTVVVTLIAVPTAIFLKEEKNPKLRTFTLNDVFNSSMRVRSYNLRWISDHEYLHKKDGSVFLYDMTTRNVSEFLNSATFAQVAAYDYSLSADRKYVAFMSNYSKVWRHSYTVSLSLYDLTTSEFLPIDIPQEVQFFSWAPEGNRLAFVWRNNVYTKAGPRVPAERVTENGRENVLLNGIPDWVYEEEMFSSNEGLWWSPGGRYVAFAEFNDTQVHTIEYSWYGKEQYPKTVVIPYPKPGTPNPVVKLFVVDATNTSKVLPVLVPSSIGAGDHYLSTVTWVTDERVAVQWLSRSQNHLVLQIYDFDGNRWSENDVCHKPKPTSPPSLILSLLPLYL